MNLLLHDAWCMPASQAHLRSDLGHNCLSSRLWALGHQVLRLVAGGVRAGLICREGQNA